MAHLEPFYLANVVLYLPSIESILKFKQINKKCQEATKMVRFYKSLPFSENVCLEEKNHIPNDLFEIFPNIETIECSSSEINESVLERVDQIHFRIFENRGNVQYIKQTIKDKVVNLSIQCYELKKSVLNDFPNLTSFTLGCFTCDLVELLEGIRLKKLTLKTFYCDDLIELRQLTDIENKTLILSHAPDIIIKLEDVKKLKQCATVVLENFETQIPINECIVTLNDFVLKKNYCYDEVYDKYLFTQCFAQSGCDLRKYKLLGKLEKRGWSDDCSVLIEGLPQLKEIVFIEQVDCIPPSVTKLCFDRFFHYQELISKDINCFSSIKDVDVSGVTTFDSNCLLHFNNCLRMSWSIGHGIKYHCHELPRSLLSLKVTLPYSKQQLEAIGQLAQLTQLSLFFLSRDPFGFQAGSIKLKPKDIPLLQKMYFELTQLKWLETNFLEDCIQLPHAISHCILFDCQSIDLFKCVNMKTIIIVAEEIESEVKVPITVKYLNISNKVTITNLSEIKPRHLVVNGFSSRQ